MMKKKRIAFYLPLVFLLLLTFCSGSVSAKEFSDVKKTDWFYPAVCFCSDTNMMVGVSEDSFAPEAAVTRGMFVTVLGRYDGIDGELYQKQVFADTDAAVWYGPYVAWAAEKGIVKGYGKNTFGPGRAMTREEMMTMLFRYEQTKQGGISADDGVLTAFADAEKVSPWATEGVAWCVENKLAQGVAPATLAPQGITSRSQLSKIMYSLVCDREDSYVATPTPGKRTLKNLLETALLPIGSTLYVYGGGWNEADDGAGIEARTIGLSPRWKEFYDSNDAFYDHKAHDATKNREKIHVGLDCSAYVGWVLYNVLETENGKPGYVMSSTKMAETFAGYGWGKYTPAANIEKRCVGDIMSMKGHVFICLGEMADGSIVLLQSSPKGPMISGTCTPQGQTDSEAIALTNYYMGKYFPDFYQRYAGNIDRGINHLQETNQMSWYLDGSGILTDPDGYGQMTPEQILKDLIGE